MSWDKPGLNGDGDQQERQRPGLDPGGPREADRPREADGTREAGGPQADAGLRDSGGRAAPGGDAGRRDWLPSDYIPYTRHEALPAGRSPRDADGPELGSTQWLEAKARLWERHAAGEDIDIPGRQIPFTTRDVREWADSPDRDRLPPPGTPVWQALQAERAARQPAETSEDAETAGEGTETAETAEGADASRATKLETRLADSNATLIGVMARQEARIERLESENDTVKAENQRLKAELAEARKDKPAEQADDPNSPTSDVGGYERSDRGQDGTQTEHEHRRIRLPSGKAAEFGKDLVIAAGAIAVGSGHLSGPMDAVVGTVIAAGVTGLEWGRDKWNRKGKNADRPES